LNWALESKPAKPVVLTGRAGSNPAPRANNLREKSSKSFVFTEIIIESGEGKKEIRKQFTITKMTKEYKTNNIFCEP